MNHSARQLTLDMGGTASAFIRIKQKTHRIGIQTRNVFLAFVFSTVSAAQREHWSVSEFRSFFSSSSFASSTCNLVCGAYHHTIRKRVQNEVSRKRITAHQCWTHKMEFYFVLFVPDVITSNCDSCSGKRTNDKNVLQCIWSLQICQHSHQTSNKRFCRRKSERFLHSFRFLVRLNHTLCDRMCKRCTGVECIRLRFVSSVIWFIFVIRTKFCPH